MYGLLKVGHHPGRILAGMVVFQEAEIQEDVELFDA